jgi:hypothetical protein
MFIESTKYIVNGFAIYLDNIKFSQDGINIKVTYSNINPLLEWIKCDKEKLVYDEDIIITNVKEPKIVVINYTIVPGFYTIDVSYKSGIYITDNQVITIGLSKGERAIHINFPQSAYKLI